jgi:class 3 adenylate cyclase
MASLVADRNESGKLRVNTLDMLAVILLYYLLAETVKRIQLRWFQRRHAIFNETTVNFVRMRYERHGLPVPQAERTFLHWRAIKWKGLVQGSSLTILFVTMLMLGYDFMQDSVEVWLRVRVRVASACVTTMIVLFSYSSSYLNITICTKVLLFFSVLYGILLLGYAIVLRDISYGIHMLFMFWILNYLPVSALHGISISLCHTLGFAIGVSLHGEKTGSYEMEKACLVLSFLSIMGAGALKREYLLRKNHLNIKVARNFTRMLKLEEERQNSLLGSMLPPEILRELKTNAVPNESKLVAEHAEVTVLFAQIDSFTSKTAGLMATSVVALLNEIWTALDAIVEAHATYKVETVGDVYMVVSGCPRLVSNHAQLAVNTAIGMLNAIAQLRLEPQWRRLNVPEFYLKFGMHTGPCVAGLLGRRFKLVGDTVNTASRMCSTSTANCIQTSTSTHRKLTGYQYGQHGMTAEHAGPYCFRARKAFEVKGKGVMQTYFVQSATPHGLPFEEPVYSLDGGLGAARQAIARERKVNFSSSCRSSPISSPSKYSSKQSDPSYSAPITSSRVGTIRADLDRIKKERARQQQAKSISISVRSDAHARNKNRSRKQNPTVVRHQQDSTSALAKICRGESGRAQMTKVVALARQSSSLKSSPEAQHLREYLKHVSTASGKTAKLSSLQVVWLLFGFAGTLIGPGDADVVENEAAYQESKFDHSIRFCRISVLLGLLIVNAILPAGDAWMFHQGSNGYNARTVLLVVRTGILTPVLLLFGYLTYTPLFSRPKFRGAVITGVLVTAGMVIITNLSVIQDGQEPEAIGLLVLFIIYVHFFEFLSIVTRLLVCVFCSFAYLGEHRAN